MMFRWIERGVMEPVGEYWGKKARERFVMDAIYELDIREDRSSASHRGYFAALSEAWANLPDHLVERIPSSEHLRKWALIRAGYRDERIIACSSPAEAQRMAAFIKPMDTFSVVMTDGKTVAVYTAKSQSSRAMDRAEFERSKTAVMEVVAALLGTTADALQRRGAEAA